VLLTVRDTGVGMTARDPTLEDSASSGYPPVSIATALDITPDGMLREQSP